MGRQAKVPRGKNRTTLLRVFQIERVEEVAARLGMDYSDVIRATLDLLIPADVADLRIRTYAAIELSFRRLRTFAFDYQSVLLAGWTGQEMMLPWQLARNTELARLLEQTVGMLRRLQPIPPDAHDRPSLPSTTLSDVVDRLLLVTSSPAVRVIEFEAPNNKRPKVLLVGTVLCTPPKPSGSRRREPEIAEQQESGPPESMYEAPSAALTDLIRDGQVEDATEEYLGGLKRVLRCSAFRINWTRCRLER